MANQQLLHLVARVASGARPFRRRRACTDLWRRIARNFDVVALALMPDHVHLLAQIDNETALRTFGRVLSAFRLAMRATAMPELAFEWEPLPPPEKVQRDRRHIARTIRYIHLNPTRDALCSDPLEWEWSTHRDWIGAVARPCVDRNRWARAMGKRTSSCTAWLHQYVSADPSVARSLPPADVEPFLRSARKDASIDALLTAVPQALRSDRVLPRKFGVAERRLFLLSAARWTRYSATELARHVGCHPTSAQRTIRQEREAKERGEAHPGTEDPIVASQLPRNVLTSEELHAMALILADPRLTMQRSVEAAAVAGK
ncbi:MAG: hypothetical protein LT102_02675 [Burkholderiaceae bacterium]|nr:hypothetical protein [Burkholderiaceae bacterium]